jgi:hypothetical protein
MVWCAFDPSLCERVHKQSTILRASATPPAAVSTNITRLFRASGPGARVASVAVLPCVWAAPGVVGSLCTHTCQDDVDSDLCNFVPLQFVSTRERPSEPTSYNANRDRLRKSQRQLCLRGFQVLALGPLLHSSALYCAVSTSTTLLTGTLAASVCRQCVVTGKDERHAAAGTANRLKPPSSRQQPPTCSVYFALGSRLPIFSSTPFV